MKCKHFERRKAQPETRLEEILTLWRDVAVATAGATNCTKSSQPAVFATRVVEDYSEFVCKIEKARDGV